MPIKVIRHTPKNKYGSFFLATEAPGDEQQPKSNVKVVSVPQNNRRKDFTAGYDTTDDDLVDDNEPTPEENNVPDDQDFTANTGAEEPAPADDGGADTAPPPEGGDQDFTDGADAGGDSGGDAGAEGEGDVAVDDTAGADDNTDFTDGAEGGDVDPNAAPPEGGDAPPPEGAPATQSGAGTDQDATRKYKLYLEYMSLYNSLSNYISKLEKIVRDDPEDNRIIGYCTKKFRDLKTLIFDYVTIKIVQNNYIQNLLFYEKLVASTQLVLKVLSNLGKLSNSKK